jgi:hypothetical protein
MYRATPLCLLVVVATGCGHPATREECEAIFQKSAELELIAHDIEDPELVESRLEQVRLARGDALIDDCVGRKITDRALDCVKRASTGDELDKCLE